MKNNIEIEEYNFESKSGIVNSEFMGKQLLLKTKISSLIQHRIEDYKVKENRFFKYQIVLPRNILKPKKVIILLHGLNEKGWKKYLPWAKSICEGTGSLVVLFPIAFHMQRVPKSWKNRQELYTLSEKRKNRFPQIKDSSLWNIIISQRLHSIPQRFVWSAMQTYYDIIKFVEECKRGEHALVDKDVTFDFFAYSIGGYLVQTLKLTNYNNYFSESKVCLFCSGATLDRVHPTSKYILDSEASSVLRRFLKEEELEKSFQRNDSLNFHLHQNLMEGRVLHSFFNYTEKQKFRERLLKKYSNYFYAITLKKDKVIPTKEITKTLNGAKNDIYIKVEELDFNEEYTHEIPFPLRNEKLVKQNINMENLFKKVNNFYNKEL